MPIKINVLISEGNVMMSVPRRRCESGGNDKGKKSKSKGFEESKLKKITCDKPITSRIIVLKKRGNGDYVHSVIFS